MLQFFSGIVLCLVDIDWLVVEDCPAEVAAAEILPSFLLMSHQYPHDPCPLPHTCDRLTPRQHTGAIFNAA